MSQELLTPNECEIKYWAPSVRAIERLGTHKPERIRQIYLSAPNDEFSLRMRRTTAPDGNQAFEATLKTRGQTLPNGEIQRFELPVTISPATFAFYDQQKLPTINKTRLNYGLGLTVDLIDGVDHPLVELENQSNVTFEQAAAIALVRQYLDAEFTPVTDGSAGDECIAWETSGQIPPAAPTVTADDITLPLRQSEIRPTIDRPYIIAISGRSGSGKTTLARQVAQILRQDFGDVPIISTDDYNRGATFLNDYLAGRQPNYDLPALFDTATLARELSQRKLAQAPIPRHSFNWGNQEPNAIEPSDTLSPIIIVEGIFANSPDLANLIDARYDLPTSVATCVGRRIARSLNGEQLGGMPALDEQLRYLVEIAEPTWLDRQNSTPALKGVGHERVCR